MIIISRRAAACNSVVNRRPAMETSTRAAARDEAASQVRCDHALYRRANAFVDRALRADCALVHTPFQIAAAALLLASQVRDM